MPKTVLITGSTDGIGLQAAKRLAAEGHTLLLHGRNPTKLADAAAEVSAAQGGGGIEQYVADLSVIADVVALADAVGEKHQSLDVLINNAGVFKAPSSQTADGLDIRFVVNTIAPYLLTRRLLPLLGANGRVINLSSAAQAPVSADAFKGLISLAHGDAYAQSKLAITMWSRHMANELGDNGPVVVAVNPGSLLATKMVQEGFGIEGNDIGIGADILVRSALSDEFAEASGKYFDNDSGQFASPHPDALDPMKNEAVVSLVETALQSLGQ